ncbi:MAG: amidohydrolase family protein [Bacteroidales bacterium]|jgi:predicted TIM-barrel fold metal-dependent hydrolase|nr:amidohydrolase family protein [Bacteroidales bacterium]
MRFRVTFFILIASILPGIAQKDLRILPVPGFENRIINYIDTIRVIDTHEHLIGPEMLKDSYFLDFSLLFMQNGYDDLVSAGMPDTLFNTLFNQQIDPVSKWKIIEPYWNNSFNTSFNRMIIHSATSLYGISELNESTVGTLSEKIRKAHDSDWFDRIIRDSCRIDYFIKDGNYIPGKDGFVRYEKRFDDWLTIRSKYRIDSLAILQLDPIYSLDDFVRSLETAFEKELKNGMIAVKIFSSYYRTLQFEKTSADAAKKVFKTLVNGEEDFKISMKEAKPLQDYMLFKLLDLARKYDKPVAIHTGIQAGKGKIIGNSNPELLTNLFIDYPDVNFVLYHGSYPYGGELASLAKNYRNVYIDMNWVYAVSPTYSERYFNEWLEMVPVSRITAFGGDCMAVENVYSELLAAKRIISKVLIIKVKEGYITESEAMRIAKMIFHDNAAKLYKLN